MKVYYFGNQDVECDNKTFDVINQIDKQNKNITFVFVKPNEDLPFINEKKVIILDTVEGIRKVSLIDDLEKFTLPKSSSVHDYDLGFQLKYLKKIGKLGEIKIIGIPMNGEIDYFLIQSILRKLVAQDMHGS